MAVTHIMARKTMPGRTSEQSMDERHKYDQKAEKTKGGELIRAYECEPESAAIDFENSRRLYWLKTGRSQSEKRDILMYRIIQSFKPGEVTPENALQIGYELAMRFTGGQHQFVVATHVDKEHIHSHIEFCAVNLDCTGKFHCDFAARVLREMSDDICREHGLSVIVHPQKNEMMPGEAAAKKYGTSWKEKLRQTIDTVLPESNGYEDFLARMRAEGYEVKEGKHLAFRASGQERFTRSQRLGNEYSREALLERFAERANEAEKSEPNRQETGQAQRTASQSGTNTRPTQSGTSPSSRKTTPSAAVQRFGRKVNPIIDIQAKLAQGKGAGYERWAKIYNLKEAAKTLNFLVEHNMADYDALVEKVDSARAEYGESSGRIKVLEARMNEIAQLKTHIIQYSKTREVYAAYRKAKNKQEFLSTHRTEIEQHEAAKRAFDALGGKPIPKVAQLSAQYGELLEQKKAEYARYKTAKQDMLDYQTALQNVDRILGSEESRRSRVIEKPR